MSHVLSKAILRSLGKRPRKTEYLCNMVEKHGLSTAENIPATVQVTLSRLKKLQRVEKNGEFWSLTDSMSAQTQTQPQAQPKRKYTRRSERKDFEEAAVKFAEAAKVVAEAAAFILSHRAELEALFKSQTPPVDLDALFKSPVDG